MDQETRIASDEPYDFDEYLVNAAPALSRRCSRLSEPRRVALPAQARPNGLISKPSRSAGVARLSRGNQASGTPITRPPRA